MINVMIADDHEMVREGLKRLIEFDDEIRVIDEAGSGEECLSKLESANPDILLLDINMPNINGIDVSKEITQNEKRPKILILTVHNEIDYLIQAVDIGVDGYILKNSSSYELIRAVKCLYSGESFIQPSLIPALNSRLIVRDIDNEKINFLTKRELQVLKLVAKGRSNKEIADELNAKEQTIKNHLVNIYRKIDCEDRTQAAVFCIKNGLTDEEM